MTRLFFWCQHRVLFRIIVLKQTFSVSRRALGFWRLSAVSSWPDRIITAESFSVSRAVGAKLLLWWRTETDPQHAGRCGPRSSLGLCAWKQFTRISFDVSNSASPLGLKSWTFLQNTSEGSKYASGIWNHTQPQCFGSEKKNKKWGWSQKLLSSLHLVQFLLNNTAKWEKILKQWL